MTKLLPCPFCGEDCGTVAQNLCHDGRPTYQVDCHYEHNMKSYGCGMSSPQYKFTTKEQAIDWWNSRASVTPFFHMSQQQDIEMISQALQRLQMSDAEHTDVHLTGPAFEALGRIKLSYLEKSLNNNG